MNLLLPLALLFSLSFSLNGLAIDINQFLQSLRTTGVQLEVHGIDRDADRFVATFRSPSNFFDYQHFALTTQDSGIKQSLRALQRHDTVWVTGDIPSLGRPFLHIELKQMRIVQSAGIVPGPTVHGVKIPDDLIGLSSIQVKVHAIHDQGRMLVVDYRGSILPVVVPKIHQSVAQGLDRGDRIAIQFVIRDEPFWPVHLSLVEQTGALQILEHMSDQHGRETQLTGDLVLFPASPQVLFNVFAVQVDYGSDFYREYTILNFDDPALFQALRQKMQTAWDSSPISPSDGRNKWIKRGLKISVKGKLNFVDPKQANPQIVVERLDDITFNSPQSP